MPCLFAVPFSPGLENPGYLVDRSPFAPLDRRDILVPLFQGLAISPGLERLGLRMLGRQF
jgi:hypothetical protein